MRAIPSWVAVSESSASGKPQSVRRMIEDGRLRALQLGGPGTAVRIVARELEAWLVQSQWRQNGGAPYVFHDPTTVRQG